MGKIKVLDESISTKIAAGEVIERPVSVVKELIENSIDAGGRHICVEIERGGKSLIKVLDDGEGMDPEDVRLAFERHATSKISSLDDIFNIKTLGFRGEALPSIGSVSLLTILTKTRGAAAGTKCVLNGGVMEKFEEAAVAEGCCVIVRNIFFNTPARLKFLQSDSREASLVVDLVARYAIGHPDISFRLSVDGKEVLYTPGNGDLREVIARIYGFDLAKEMIHINKTFDFGCIDGFISPPKYTRGNRSWETFFVNGRLVKDRGLSASLERAYRTLLPGDKFPIAFIKIDIDGSLVDVNVHPAKIEIRFQRENEVHQSLYETVKESLFSTTLVPKEELPIPKTTFPKPKNYDGAVNENFLKEEYFTKTYGKIENKPVFTETAATAEPKKYFVPKTKEKNSAPEIYFSRILGQLFETYIVVQGNGEFYLIDQHAAHERILYEYYSCGMDLPVISQELVSPFVLKLTFEEINFIEENRDFIKRMGFDIEVFGKDTALIRSVPYFFNKPVEPASLQEVMDELKENGEFRIRSREKLLASMACHTAIKAGDTLSPDEMRELLDQLMRTQNPYSCPHGRPTMISISLYELEKKFRRVNG
ncbi:DNA mismatch repair endonuclease MutL [Thermosediminibacter litoriperuensis]|uniref:DNA mismatch repair protein MutL n=1 Tax=Thermosediminibacter litoriperuensis TaxID=291989 RepID=A0A5S5AFY9_9FIRM|nr:DNA mismatch repair endonuclease MutL [Thermosediminibacter litoriperuensis]TYP48685.1 DNA mismatch repair protein MutL [Thermosediminibacter litoriperuensis]